MIRRLLTLQSLIQKFAGPAVLTALLLFMRIVWGWGFFLAGKGKLSDISKPIAFFTDLGIPAPTLNAYFVSSLECVGGLLLLVGLFSRPIAFLLTGNMIVALLTAHRKDVFPPLFNEADPAPLFAAAPFWFLVTSVIVLALGPGKLSLDALLRFILVRVAGIPAGEPRLVHNPVSIPAPAV